MGLIEKIQEILTIKNNIKIALENKNVVVDNVSFSKYPILIESIQSSSGGEDDWEITDASHLFYNGARTDIFEILMKRIKKPTSCSTMCCYFDNITQEQFNMFENIDFINCTNLGNAFNFRAVNLIVPLLKNTENVENMSYAFRTNASTKNPRTRVFNNPIDSNNCNNLSYAFEGVKFINNTEYETPLSTTENVTKMSYTFNNTSGLYSFTKYDTSKVNNFSYAFYDSVDLEKVDINISVATSFTHTFTNCINLVDLKFTGTTIVKTNISLSSTGLDAEGLMNMLETLPDISTSRTITIGSEKMALLSDEQIAEFSLKGYSLA